MKNIVFTSYIYLTLSALFYGLLVFGGKLMGVAGFSLMEVLIIPNLIVVIALGLLTKPEFKKFFKVAWWINLLYPVVIILGQVGQFAPLFMGLSVSLTVFLLNTQPLWTSIISTLFLKTKFTKKDAIIVTFTILGLFLLLAPWQEFQLSLWGFLVAITGGIMTSGWIILNGSFYSKQNLKPTSINFFTNLYQSIPFLIFLPLMMKIYPDATISGISFDKSLMAIVFVFLYSISVFIAAPCLFYAAARKINNVHLGLVLLLEPVVGTILDVSFLGTVLTWNMFLGGILILSANAYLVVMSKDKEIKE